MTVFDASVMIALQAGELEEDVKPCVVTLTENTITVEYFLDGQVTYSGDIDPNHPGHYFLTAPMAHGEATLHRIPNTDTLEGSWKEAGFKGYWKIELATAED